MLQSQACPVLPFALLRGHHGLPRRLRAQHILKPIREAAPNTWIDFIGGDHEAHMLHHLAVESLALRTVLANLHVWIVR